MRAKKTPPKPSRKTTSPAKDAGTSTGMPAGHTRDINNTIAGAHIPPSYADNQAMFGSAWDIGADEFVDTDGDGLSAWYETGHGTDPDGPDIVGYAIICVGKISSGEGHDAHESPPPVDGRGGIFLCVGQTGGAEGDNGRIIGGDNSD